MIAMAIPGVAPEQVDIDVVGRTLRIRGERRVEKNVEKAEAILSEINYGRFEREFTLPEDIDSEKVQASSDQADDSAGLTFQAAAPASAPVQSQISLLVPFATLMIRLPIAGAVMMAG